MNINRTVLYTLLVTSPCLPFSAQAGEILNLFPVSTFNDNEDALWLFGPDSFIQNHSSVKTYGISADALRTAGLNGTVINGVNGSVETHGDYFAVGIRTAGDKIVVRNHGSIKTYGINGDGIVLFGNGNAEGLLSIPDPQNIWGNLVINSGTIETNGAGADGFVVEGDRTTFQNSGVVINNSGLQTALQDGTPTHENGTAVWLYGSNNRLLNSGEIRSTAANSTTVQVGAFGSILNSGLIENSGGADAQALGFRDGAAVVLGADAVLDNVGTINGKVIGAFGGETLKLGSVGVINGVVDMNPNGFDDFLGHVDTLQVNSVAGVSQLDGDKFLRFNEFEKTGGGAVALSGHLDLSSARLSSEARIVKGDLTLMNASLTADQVLISSGAALKGSGAINGDVFIQDGGLFSVGQSAGRMNIAGDLVLDTGILNIEFGGTGAGQFDEINVGGAVTFSNTDVIFSFINGYVPKIGDLINFIGADAILGLDTARFSYTGLVHGFVFDLVDTGNGLLGFQALSDGVADEVPEPATLGLLALGLIGFLSRKRM